MDLPEKTEIRTNADPSQILGLTRKQRIKIYFWGAIALIIGAFFLSWLYLRPDKWYTYTDKTIIQKSATDVDLGYVTWEKSKLEDNNFIGRDAIMQPSISSDGAHMVYLSGEKNSDLFIRIWDGKKW